MSNTRKPALRRVPSDDLVIEEGGELYTPHAGEWVEILPGFRVADFRVVQALADLQVTMQALRGEDDGELRAMVAASEAYALTLAEIRTRVIRWSWTDDLGRPYPQPCDHPEVIDALRIEEVNYLGRVIRQQNPAQEKKGLSTSPTTSSATASPPSPTERSTDPSPTPASLPRSVRRSAARQM